MAEHLEAVERAAWRWDRDSLWVSYPSVQEAVDSLYRHGGGEVRGWLALPANDGASAMPARGGSHA